jgi:hypothetical protein
VFSGSRLDPDFIMPVRSLMVWRLRNSASTKESIYSRDHSEADIFHIVLLPCQFHAEVIPYSTPVLPLLYLRQNRS